MLLILSTLSALADPPTQCDPRKDTAAADRGGYCLSEDAFAECTELRIGVAELSAKVEARDAEIVAFEQWKEAQSAEWTAALRNAAAECTTTMAAVQGRCAADVALARKRTLLERHGFAAGLVVGTAGTVVLTAIVLDVYGAAVR